MSLFVRFVIAGAVAGIIGSAAIASDAPTSRKKEPRDPNEIVCEKQEVIGSRLASKRVCRTRSEWAEQRRLDREVVGRSQVQSCQRQAGC